VKKYSAQRINAIQSLPFPAGFARAINAVGKNSAHKKPELVGT